MKISSEWNVKINLVVLSQCLGDDCSEPAAEFPSKYCTPRRKPTQTTHNYDNSSKFCDFKLFMRRHGRWFSATPAFVWNSAVDQTSVVLGYDRQLITSPPSAEVVFRLKQINYTWNMPATQERDTWVQLVWKKCHFLNSSGSFSSNGSCHWHNTTTLTR